MDTTEGQKSGVARAVVARQSWSASQGTEYVSTEDAYAEAREAPLLGDSDNRNDFIEIEPPRASRRRAIDNSAPGRQQLGFPNSPYPAPELAADPGAPNNAEFQWSVENDATR